MPESDRAALSPRQRDALAAVHQFQAVHGRPPTRAELGEVLGVRAQTADFHLRALARKGYLVLERGARAIRATEPDLTPSAEPARASDWHRVPVLGAVQAGLPQFAIEQLAGSVPVPPGTRADFALRVHGDSMIDAGILDGDLVLVQRATQARSGQTVVAFLGEGETIETTVKTWWQQAGQAPELRPANPAFQPHVLDGDEAVRLAGIVVGLYRGQEGIGG